ncbi:uncharacterized protein LOC126735243 [Anthonomus grandis grandis]|uniref:uncharacterized protein LOC126735243 n=1 Tax=Anthonomus grandis grandis TaxID=2921223 RepID=UPI0021658888|nr:uncharacterized protein LOC126735243 [Anthonomus grandis grandis]
MSPMSPMDTPLRDVSINDNVDGSVLEKPSKQSEKQVDAVYIPPKVDQLTDEEEFSEDPENIENSQNGDIAGTFEIHTVRDEIYDESDEEDLATKRRKILEKKAVSYNPRRSWFHFIGDLDHSYRRIYLYPKKRNTFKNLGANWRVCVPLDIFFKFVVENLMDLIIQFSEKYAQDNNRHEFHLSREELLNFLGILILSGYHSLPQTYMYWSLDEDKTVHIVRDCMNRNKFRSIKRDLHFSDNNNLDKGHKYTKLRPFFDTMNEKFLQFDIFSFNFSIDGQMVPYFACRQALDISTNSFLMREQQRRTVILDLVRL